AGCTRHFFRNRADEEVVEVLTEKDQYENARIENFHVYPNERARFADPSDPDHPPKPPDDPAAYDLSPNPQKPGTSGVALESGTGYLELLEAWDKENREADAKAAGALTSQDAATAPGSTAAPASSKTKTSLDIPPEKARAYRLNLAQAAELGLINSREYQDRREDLYLPALPVTLEPMTQVQRKLPYQNRTYARFRKAVFVAIAGGGVFSRGVFTPAGVITPTTVSPTAGVGSSGGVPGNIAPFQSAATLAVSPG